MPVPPGVWVQVWLTSAWPGAEAWPLTALRAIARLVEDAWEVLRGVEGIGVSACRRVCGCWFPS